MVTHVRPATIVTDANSMTITPPKRTPPTTEQIDLAVRYLTAAARKALDAGYTEEAKDLAAVAIHLSPPISPAEMTDAMLRARAEAYANQMGPSQAALDRLYGGSHGVNPYGR